MKIISWILNSIALLILAGCLFVVAYALWFLSVIVGMTVTDVIIVATIGTFVLWRLHVMFK